MHDLLGFLVRFNILTFQRICACSLLVVTCKAYHWPHISQLILHTFIWSYLQVKFFSGPRCTHISDWIYAFNICTYMSLDKNISKWPWECTVTYVQEKGKKNWTSDGVPIWSVKYLGLIMGAEPVSLGLLDILIRWSIFDSFFGFSWNWGLRGLACSLESHKVWRWDLLLRT